MRCLNLTCKAILLALVAGATLSDEAGEPPYESESFARGVTSRATGFFRVEKLPDGRWWVIDPKGRGTVALGVDHVQSRGHGSAERSPKWRYREHNRTAYPNIEAWRDETIARLRKWGFNLLGSGSDPALRHRGLVHTSFLSFGASFCRQAEDCDRYICPNEGRPCSAMPNPFHPDFRNWCDKIAREKCAPNRDDPWLLGYFLDNELAWWGRGDRETGLWDAVLALAEGHSARRALVEWAERSGVDVAKATASEKSAFVSFAAQQYFAATVSAVKRHDPNHMVLGARFAGERGAPKCVWETAGKWCDMVTFNAYPWVDLETHEIFNSPGDRSRLATDVYQTLYDLVKRPILLTEWSFPALDSGLPCTNGAGQRFRTQAERTLASELYARTLLSLPFCIGYSYFMWVDEPPEGISDAFPEDSNYGLVSESGVPYPLTEMFASLHRDILAVRTEGAPKALHGESSLSTSRAGHAVPDWKVNGRSVGSFTMMLSFEVDGVRKWIDCSHVKSSISRSVPGGEERTIVASGKNGRHASFEMAFSLFFPASGDEFVATLRAIRNTGTVPLKNCWVYFRTYAPYAHERDGGYADGQNVWDRNAKRVPNLWKGAVLDCWLAADGRYIGGYSTARSAISCNYRVSGNGSAQHPDALFRPAGLADLQPGETYVDDGDCWFVVLGGTDGLAGWRARTKDL